MPRITHGGVSDAGVVEPVEPGTVVDQAVEADPIVVDEHGDDAAAVADAPATTEPAPRRRR